MCSCSVPSHFLARPIYMCLSGSGLIRIRECEWVNCLFARCVAEIEGRAERETDASRRDRKSKRDREILQENKVKSLMAGINWN